MAQHPMTLDESIELLAQCRRDAAAARGDAEPPDLTAQAILQRALDDRRRDTANVIPIRRE